jgi:hypothetical protein
MAERKSPFKFLIDLPVRNHWENVDLLRTSLLNCFTAIFSEVDGVHSFATVAAELLENAIKYGQWTEASSRLHLRVSGDNGTARVEVENPVDPASENVKDLLATIAWLKTFPSPEEAYRARLLQVATAEAGVSRLGLARIAYEANATLVARVDENILRVTCVTNVV